jgi:hypothetical protein
MQNLDIHPLIGRQNRKESLENKSGLSLNVNNLDININNVFDSDYKKFDGFFLNYFSCVDLNNISSSYGKVKDPDLYLQLGENSSDPLIISKNILLTVLEVILQKAYGEKVLVEGIGYLITEQYCSSKGTIKNNTISCLNTFNSIDEVLRIYSQRLYAVINGEEDTDISGEIVFGYDGGVVVDHTAVGNIYSLNLRILLPKKYLKNKLVPCLRDKGFILIDFKDFILINYVFPISLNLLLIEIIKLNILINSYKDIIYKKTSLILELNKSIINYSERELFIINKSLIVVKSLSINKQDINSKKNIVTKPGKSCMVGVLNKNKKIIAYCGSLRETSRNYEITRSTLSRTYLDKNRLFNNKYYFITINQKHSFSTIIKVINTKNLFLSEFINEENKNMTFLNRFKTYLKKLFIKFLFRFIINLISYIIYIYIIYFLISFNINFNDYRFFIEDLLSHDCFAILDNTNNYISFDNIDYKEIIHNSKEHFSIPD